MNGPRRQRGMTLIGIMIIAAMVGIIGYGVIRLIPVYMTQFKIQRLLNDLRSDFEGNAPTPGALRTAISNQLDIEMVEFPTYRDFVIRPVDDGFQVGVTYEDRVPFIGNLYLGAEFDNQVNIRR